MLLVRRFCAQTPVMLSFSRAAASVLAFAALTVFSLHAGGQSPAASPAAPGAQPPANQAVQAPCPPGPDMDIPITSTIEAKVSGTLDSAHLKPGKQIWVNVVDGLVFPGCTLNAGAALYGHVTAAASEKNTDSSELSLVFDHADCEGHGKKAMPLWLIGILGPQDQQSKAHDAVPLGLHGQARSISAAVAATSNVDDSLNPGGPPKTVHPGIVIGLPGSKLEIQGGPGCSTRISSTRSSVQLFTGSELIFVVQSK